MSTREILEFLGHEPTEELTKKLDFHFSVARKTPQGMTLEKIFGYVAEKYEIKYEDLFIKCRKREIVAPRQEGIYLSKMLGFKVVHIARFLNKDHSTILVSIDTIKDAMDTIPEYRAQIQNDLSFLTI